MTVRCSTGYNAACYALLSAAGKGEDVPSDGKIRAQLRTQALEWLRAELSAWAEMRADGGTGDLRFITEALRHWKQDADLASVREPTSLAKLPEEERAAFLELWSDVDKLLSDSER